MYRTLVKTTAIVTVVVLLGGGMLLGQDLYSYAKSSAKSVQSAVKDSVPIEFELRRARDLLAEIIPDMQANIKLIAGEEVDVAELETDIAECQDRLAQERDRIQRVRSMLTSEQVSYRISGQHYNRAALLEDLARRFDRFRESELILAGKDRLLTAREASLRGAMQTLDRTRAQKARLADQIAGLESQFRLIQAAAVGSKFHMDNTALAKTETLIRDVRKRLDVAERVLAHEAKFVDTIPVDQAVDNEDVLVLMDEYFASPADGLPVDDDSVATAQPSATVTDIDG